MAIARSYPRGEVLPLRDVMTRLFEQSMVGPHGFGQSPVPTLTDVYQEGDDYVIEVTLPGVKPEQVDVSVLGNQITIRGAYEAPPEGRQYLHQERSAGRFERTLTLPTELNADKARARLEHGLLRLTVPKAESAKARRIALTNGQ
jgi:HSP20 family protein